MPRLFISSWQLVTYLIVGAACLIGLVLVAVLYPSAPAAEKKGETGTAGVKFSWQEMWLVILSGLIWALFNGGFIIFPIQW